MFRWCRWVDARGATIGVRVHHEGKDLWRQRFRRRGDANTQHRIALVDHAMHLTRSLNASMASRERTLRTLESQGQLGASRTRKGRPQQAAGSAVR